MKQTGLYYENIINWLNKIGITLSAEKDTNNLLKIILEGSMEITSSDGGSIYVVENMEDGKQYLKFIESKNSSREFPFQSFSFPVDSNSISGACVVNQKSYKFDNIKEDVMKQLGIVHNDYFDKQLNYKTVNMLIVPLNNKENKTIGVLQLVNKKTEYHRKLNGDEDFNTYIFPYSELEENIIKSLASQTAILFERNILLKEKQQLFDSFIESMVTTIERRDKTTSGHSIRVAKYMVEFCKAINKIEEGKYKDIHFNEASILSMYYAGLLHDVGKIGVKEDVLLKRNKLTDSELEALKYRMYYYKEQCILKQVKNKIKGHNQIEEIDKLCNFIEAINLKTYVSEEELSKIKDLEEYMFDDIDGIKKNLFTPREIENLSVRKGNLTQSERLKMEMHSEYTYEILKDITWDSELKSVPQITSGHHEKLNGQGYPRGLREEEVNFETRILAIVDIFEALTALDRPYRKPMPKEKAIEILLEDANRNELDLALVEIFIQEKVYEKL